MTPDRRLRNSCFPRRRDEPLVRAPACRQGWSKPQTRGGITMLEVAVVLGIVGLLASLIVPAVASARAASRRTQCQSRLQQILGAFHAHEAAEGVFPAYQFHANLLPYLGVAPDAMQTVLYVCPEDPESIGKWMSARQSYYINKGIALKSQEGFTPPPGQAGLSAAAIRDGLSNTVAIAERLAWPSIGGHLVDWELYPQWWNRRLRDTAVSHTDLNAFADECEHRALPPLTMWLSVGQSYNHVVPPNRNSCINYHLFDPLKAVTASSLHSNGVHVGMSDGAVRFVSDDIDRTVWHALGTRSGREVMSRF